LTALRDLARNIGAGARLVLGLPVHRLTFRIDVTQLLLVFAFSALIDVAGDWARYGPDANFSWLGAGNEVYSLGLLIAVSAIIAVACRRASLALALPVIVLSSSPLIQAVDIGLTVVLASVDIPQFAASWLAYLVPVWFVAMIVRATWTAFEGEGQRRLPVVLVSSAALAALVWFSPTLFPSMPWWQTDSSVDAGTGSSPASELVQAAQRQLLDNALDALADERPGITDLYFVGFAADARERGSRDDVSRAQQVMDDRWDTRTRSIVLANDENAVLETPFATVTNLRETLREIGGSIDLDSDVVMIYIVGRGGAGGVEVSNAPLDLLPLSPSTLKALLDDAGIKWRIIVVSACRSAAFQDALADDSTVVLTSDADGGAACSDKDMHRLGEALFGHALSEQNSFAGALDAAAKAGGKRSLAVGSGIADVLKALDRGSAARRSGRTV
jgi:hypothetical protein